MCTSMPRSTPSYRCRRSICKRCTVEEWLCNLFVLNRNRSFWGFGRPRGPRRPLQKVRERSPEALLHIVVAEDLQTMHRGCMQVTKCNRPSPINRTPPIRQPIRQPIPRPPSPSQPSQLPCRKLRAPGGLLDAPRNAPWMFRRLQATLAC